MRYLKSILVFPILFSAGGVFAATSVGTPSNSIYVLNKYGLQLGSDCDLVDAVDGGFVVGSVVAENQDQGDGTVKKHLANTSVEDVHARIRYDQFTQFLSDSLEGKASSSAGAIFYLTNGGQVQQQRNLTGMTLTQLTLPAMDASGRAAYAMEMQIGLAVESAGMGTVLAGALPPVSAANAQKKAQVWSGDFRLTIPGLPTSHVRSIEAINITRTVATPGAGAVRDVQSAGPGHWNFPNLVFYVQPDDSQAFVAWHEDFVINGHHLDSDEKTLTLELLTKDLKTVVFTLQGKGVGILSAKYEQPVATGAPTTPGFRVELYVEKMSIDAPGTAAVAAPTDSGIKKPLVPTTRPSLNLPVR